MTSEDRAERRSSKNSSGEQSDPRESESRSDSEQSSGGERSEEPRDSEDRAERRSPEKSSGEEQRDANGESVSETRTGSEAPREQSDDPRDGENSTGGSDEGIPLDISGHEDRDRPDGASSMLGNGSADDTPDEGPDGDGSHEENTATEADELESVESDESDGDDEEVQPVEVLVQLAKDGEIEPWDIDIVVVTDKFLDRLDEADLRTGGRALFYASVLLRMKSDAMLAEDPEEDGEFEEPWQEAMAADSPVEPGGDPFASLEQEMDRRLERKRARGTPQTLDELVRDLREAERDNWWKESREYDTSDSPGGFQRGTQELDYHSADALRMDDEPTEADVTGTAHGEDIDRIIDDVYAACLEQWEAGRSEVLYAEIVDAGGSRVETFLGLLFLAHRGQVRLQQDELFGDLWVQDPNAALGSEEAVAD